MTTPSSAQGKELIERWASLPAALSQQKAKGDA